MATSIGRSIHRYFLLNHPFFKTSADDKLKWIPFGVLFLLNLFGTRTRSGWKKQVLIAGAAEAIKYLISDNLEKLTHEHRPAPYTGNHSLPSGHTSTAFSTAEFLHSELKHSLPVFSYSGYVAATAVAVIRVMKNRHWVRDVVVGAAVGIISTRLAYALVNRLDRTRRGIKKRREEKERKHYEFRPEGSISNRPYTAGH